jgi:hypothetical protein
VKDPTNFNEAIAVAWVSLQKTNDLSFWWAQEYLFEPSTWEDQETYRNLTLTILDAAIREGMIEEFTGTLFEQYLNSNESLGDLIWLADQRPQEVSECLRFVDLGHFGFFPMAAISVRVVTDILHNEAELRKDSEH